MVQIPCINAILDIFLKERTKKENKLMQKESYSDKNVESNNLLVYGKSADAIEDNGIYLLDQDH